MVTTSFKYAVFETCAKLRIKNVALDSLHWKFGLFFLYIFASNWLSVLLHWKQYGYLVEN